MAGLEYIYEPLAYWKFPEPANREAAGNDPRPHLYLRRGEGTQWEAYLRRALQGGVRNGWTVRTNEGARRKVVKTIRANLMIDWLMGEMRFLPVYVTRNPLAVISSQLDCEMESSVRRLETYFFRRSLYEDHLGPFEDLIRAADAGGGREKYIEFLAVLWCVLTLVPWRQGLFERMLIVGYEELFRNPEAVLSRLESGLHLRFDRRTRDRVRERSELDLAETRGRGYNPLEAWRSRLSGAEAERIVSIVRRFGLEGFLDTGAAAAQG